MKNFTLIRIAYIPDGTFGVLFDEDIPFCLTLEREWKDNQRGESCIPVGGYICDRVQSPKFGDTFKVQNVYQRSDILFHKGNIEDDSHGCIILGEQYHKYKGKISIKASREGYAEFKERTKDVNSFSLGIKDVNI